MKSKIQIEDIYKSYAFQRSSSEYSYLSFTCKDRGIPYIVKPVVRGHFWDKEKVTTWAGLTVLLIWWPLMYGFWLPLWYLQTRLVEDNFNGHLYQIWFQFTTRFQKRLKWKKIRGWQTHVKRTRLWVMQGFNWICIINGPLVW